MRAVVIVAGLAFVCHSIADPGARMEKMMGKAFVPTAASPPRAGHMFLYPGAPVARADRAPVANFPVSARDKSIAHLRSEIFKLEETNDRMKEELESVRFRMATMAQAMPIDAQNWTSTALSFGWLGYGFGATLLFLTVGRFFIHGIGRVPAIRMNHLDGADDVAVLDVATDPLARMQKDGVVRISRAIDESSALRLHDFVLDRFAQSRRMKRSVWNRLRFLLAKSAGAESIDDSRLILHLPPDDPIVSEVLAELLSEASPSGSIIDNFAGGSQAKLLEVSAVISLPGAAPQDFHAEAASDEGFFTIFVALQPVCKEMGPTYFALGTNTEATKRFPVDHAYHEEFLEQNVNLVRRSCLDRGDAIIFDGSIVHAGGGNTSSQIRVLFSCTFRPPHVKPNTEMMILEKTIELCTFPDSNIIESMRSGEYRGMRGWKNRIARGLPRLWQKIKITSGIATAGAMTRIMCTEILEDHRIGLQRQYDLTITDDIMQYAIDCSTSSILRGLALLKFKLFGMRAINSLTLFEPLVTLRLLDDSCLKAKLRRDALVPRVLTKRHVEIAVKKQREKIRKLMKSKDMLGFIQYVIGFTRIIRTNRWTS